MEAGKEEENKRSSVYTDRSEDEDTPLDVTIETFRKTYERTCRGAPYPEAKALFEKIKKDMPTNNKMEAAVYLTDVLDVKFKGKTDKKRPCRLRSLYSHFQAWEQDCWQTSVDLMLYKTEEVGEFIERSDWEVYNGFEMGGLAVHDFKYKKEWGHDDCMNHIKLFLFQLKGLLLPDEPVEGVAALAIELIREFIETIESGAYPIDWNPEEWLTNWFDLCSEEVMVELAEKYKALPDERNPDIHSTGFLLVYDMMKCFYQGLHKFKQKNRKEGTVDCGGTFYGWKQHWDQREEEKKEEVKAPLDDKAMVTMEQEYQNA